MHRHLSIGREFEYLSAVEWRDFTRRWRYPWHYQVLRPLGLISRGLPRPLYRRMLEVRRNSVPGNASGGP